MVNLSAEALVAAEQGHTRKLNERETGFGESWEQVHGLIGGYIGVEVSDQAQVRWRDTEARSFAAVVDGLAKLADSLEIPKEALWERIPDVTDQDIARWRELRREGDALASLFEDIDRQLASPQPAVTDAADG